MKKSILYGIAAAFGAGYFLFLIFRFGTVLFEAGSIAAAAGMVLGFSMLIPHIILVSGAVVINVIAFLNNKEWAGILAGVLYIIAGLAFLFYIFYVIPSAVLCFVGTAILLKKK